MAMLTEPMQRLIQEQKLGFVATVTPEGLPNLSPKGTLSVWDEDHLIFADLASPQTVLDLRVHPELEVNVVDPFSRRGYRFKGRAEVLEPGAGSGRYLAFFERLGVLRPHERIHTIVLVTVLDAREIRSPTYDSGITEEEVRRRWREYYDRLAAGESGLSDPA